MKYFQLFLFSTLLFGCSSEEERENPQTFIMGNIDSYIDACQQRAYDSLSNLKPQTNWWLDNAPRVSEANEGAVEIYVNSYLVFTNQSYSQGSYREMMSSLESAEINSVESASNRAIRLARGGTVIENFIFTPCTVIYDEDLLRNGFEQRGLDISVYKDNYRIIPFVSF